MKHNFMEKMKGIVGQKPVPQQVETDEQRAARLADEKEKHYLNVIMPATKTIWQNKRLMELTGVKDFTAENVKSFVCFIHPLMADLDRELMIKVNGKTASYRIENDCSLQDYTAKMICFVE